MRFDILTIFPNMFAGPLDESIIKRARQAGHIEIFLHNIRDYAKDRHRTTDDTPYGGGAGMVMKAEPLAAALRAIVPPLPAPPAPPASFPSPDESNSLVLLMSPEGEPLTQEVVEDLARWPHLVLVCGRYEGVDERIRQTLIHREVSIGDYVLTGGELAAMVVVDAVARLVPGVLDSESLSEESHSGSLLEYPHYTRPAIWEGQRIPPILLSGHHGEIAAWRRRQRVRRTLLRRPDLLRRAAARGLLTSDDLQALATTPNPDPWNPGP